MPFGFGRGGGKWWGEWLGRGREKTRRPGRPENCICSVCGHVAQKVPGTPCFLMPCPRCGSRMARKFDYEE